MYNINVDLDLNYIYTNPDSDVEVGRRLTAAGPQSIRGIMYHPSGSSMSFDWTGENFNVPVRYDSNSGYCSFKRFVKYLNALKTYLKFMDVSFNVVGLPKKLQLTNSKGNVYARYM